MYSDGELTLLRVSINTAPACACQVIFS